MTDDKQIPWFNPREMDDATLLSLATGRELLLNDFFQTVKERLNEDSDKTTGTHWLVTGTRGSGKSYFLRYAQIKTTTHFPRDDVRFVLLPEELRNVRSAHDLLDEIRRMLQVEQGNQGRASMWRTENPEQAWEASLQQLLGAFDARLLIVGVENFAQILEKAFSTDALASLLRKLMEHEPRIMFLATALDGSFDENYKQRLFRQFEHHQIPAWNAKEHRKYLYLRAKVLQRKPTAQQLARIDAYSRYTGGNARVAAILAATILEEQDLLSAGVDLNATLDKMSDYYRALLDLMPPNTETLFDALVRGGEPCSQTQLAERVGAKQNDISRAFSWLLDVNYLRASRKKGQKETLYQVADRLFVQWYRMRYLDPGQRSRLAVLAELLADTVAFGDKWRYAQGFAAQGEEADALLMADLGFKARGIDIKTLQADGAALPELLQYGQRLIDIDDSKAKASAGSNLLTLLEMYPSDECMREELRIAINLAKSCHRFPDLPSGKKLMELCLGSLSLSAVEKLRVARATTSINEFQWTELCKVFEDESIEFEKLMPNEGEIIKGLEEHRKQQLQYPWTLAWGAESVINIIQQDYPAHDHFMLQATGNAVFCFAAIKASNKHISAESAAVRLGRELNELVFSNGWYDLSLNLMQKLLTALPKKALPELQAHMTLLCSNIYSVAGSDLQSVVWAKKAIAYCQKMPPSREQLACICDAQERIGWTFGQDNNWLAALKVHQDVLLDIKKSKFDLNTSWHAGQAARYIWNSQNLEAAWDWIQTIAFKKTSEISQCVGQLGDAVCDVARTQGDSAAYAAGRQLFSSLNSKAKIPLLAFVRSLFINMLDTGLNLNVLSDLAQDLPDLIVINDESITDKTSDSDVEAIPNLNADLPTLAQALQKWLANLQDPLKATQDTDPDWLATLKGLNEALSFRARLRLGLVKKPVLGSESAALQNRMLAFLK
jgi:hypothetical protein